MGKWKRTGQTKMPPRSEGEEERQIAGCSQHPATIVSQEALLRRGGMRKMARGFNKIILFGNLARDPELRYTPQGKSVVRMTIAVNRQWKGQNGETHEDVDFFPVIVWGKMAENCDTFLKKGSAILVEGRLATRDYQDKEGVKRYVTEVLAQGVQFMPSGSGKGRKSDLESPQGDRYSSKGSGADDVDFSGSDDEPLPF